MLERRRYERYLIFHAEDKKAKIEITVEGEAVHLVDFSLGGLSFFSEKQFSTDKLVNLSIDLENKGKIDLMGIVVRTEPVPDSGRWCIAIDFSQTYKMTPIRKE
ncbi:MAG: PilZ domain-containing protein [Syntrophaceae bacterium]